LEIPLILIAIEDAPSGSESQELMASPETSGQEALDFARESSRGQSQKENHLFEIPFFYIHSG